MNVTIVYYSDEIKRVIVETTEVNPQSSQELDSILREMRVARISKESADVAVQNGALDLRRE